MNATTRSAILRAGLLALLVFAFIIPHKAEAKSVKDQSPYHNDGILFGDVKIVDDETWGKVAYFDWTDYLHAPYIGSLNTIGIGTSSPRTVSIWFKTMDDVNRQAMLGWGAIGTCNAFNLAYGVANSEYPYFIGWNCDIEAPDSASAFDWHNYTVVYTGSSIKQYIDGNWLSEDSLTLDTTDTRLFIGKQNYDDPSLTYWPFKGYIACPTVWKTALSNDQISDYYNYSYTSNCYQLPEQTSIVLQYNFNDIITDSNGTQDIVFGTSLIIFILATIYGTLVVSIFKKW